MKYSYALANIAGVLQVILLTGKFLIYFWSKNSMLEFVISQVITEEEREKRIVFFEENNKKLLSPADFSLKNISKLNNNPNLNLNYDNIEPKDKNNDLNSEALSKINKTQRSFVKKDDNSSSIPNTLKYPQAFLKNIRHNKSRFINNESNNTSNMNLKINQESNQLKEINAIKSVYSTFTANDNKDIRNCNLILSDNEGKLIENADDKSYNVLNQEETYFNFYLITVYNLFLFLFYFVLF